jgi:hypothetical protein
MIFQKTFLPKSEEEENEATDKQTAEPDNTLRQEEEKAEVNEESGATDNDSDEFEKPVKPE